MPIAPEKLQNLDPEFTRRLEAAAAAAEAATGASTPITDAYRDSKTQAQYYANYTQKPVTWEGVTYKPQKQGGLAAAPGQSYHQSGKAVDIASGPVLDWLHQNAGKFGLEFLPGAAGKMDPVHIQLAGSNAQFAGNPFGATGTAPPPLPNLRATDVATATPAAPQPGSPGFVDNLGGGMSPLHQFSVAEASDIPPGPYGADAFLRAAISGDPAALSAAEDAILKSAIDKEGYLGLGKAKDALQAYLDSLSASSPGAIRAAQTAFNQSAALKAAVNPMLTPFMDKAFAALPPQATGQVAMPNLRPPQPDAQPPLVAGPTPDPLAPKMASFAPPSQPGGFGSGLDPTQLGTLQKLITGGGADSWMPSVARSLSNLVTAPGSQEAPFVPPDGQYADYWKGKMFNSTNAPGFNPSNPTAYRDQFGEWSIPDTNDAQGNWSPDQLQQLFRPPPSASGDNLDMRTNPGSANASPVAYSKPAGDAAGLAQLLGRIPGTAQSTAFGAQDSTPSPWDQNAMRPPTGIPSPFAWDKGMDTSPQQYWTPPPAPSPMLSSLTGGYGPATQSTFGPSPMLSSLTGGYGAANGWLVPPPAPTKTVQIGQVPPAPQQRPLMPPPAPAVSAAPFGVQNVNWAATNAADPWAQPGTQNTLVLNDLDAERNSIGQTDSYYNLPAFSWA